MEQRPRRHPALIEVARRKRVLRTNDDQESAEQADGERNGDAHTQSRSAAPHGGFGHDPASAPSASGATGTPPRAPVIVVRHQPARRSKVVSITTGIWPSFGRISTITTHGR